MPLYLTNEQLQHLAILRERQSDDIIELCKSAFEYVTNGPNLQKYQILAEKYASNPESVQKSVEALISLLIDATKANAGETELKRFQEEIGGFSDEVLEILTQFVTSKRNFIESSIKTANIRAYRLVNLEWRLEVRVASRCLHRQSNIFVTMKLYLHTEPKNENRDLLEEDREEAIHPDEQQNRKDLLVQTDLISLSYIIKNLEDALQESKSRRNRNIVNAIH